MYLENKMLNLLLGLIQLLQIYKVIKNSFLWKEYTIKNVLKVLLEERIIKYKKAFENIKMFYQWFMLESSKKRTEGADGVFITISYTAIPPVLLTLSYYYRVGIEYIDNCCLFLINQFPVT